MEQRKHAVTIYLLRHGQTALNAEGRIRGLADPELDAVGIEQAHAAAMALKRHGIVRVISSPLRRAKKTGDIVAEASGVICETDPAVNDRDYGQWTGHVKADVVAAWGSIDDAPGVEAQDIVLERSVGALRALADEGSSPVAVVTHDAVIRPILTSIDPMVNAEIETGSWAELACVDGTWSVVSAGA